jgi:hypothetical protein
MKRFACLSLNGLLAWLLVAAAPAGAEDGVKELKEAPPKELSANVSKVLDETGYQVTAGGKVVCEIWLAKQWAAKAKFTPSLSILYPLEPGELLGAIRYPKKAGDYRKQQIRPGTYTMRYALQPEDGSHVGTSMTRDFSVLLPAAKDATPARLSDVKAMFKLSAEVSRGTHPSILQLLAAPSGAKSPEVRHMEEGELWSVVLIGKAKAGDRASDLPIELVIVGHAAE